MTTDVDDQLADQLVVDRLRAALQSPGTVEELAGERAARRAFALAQYDLGPAAAAPSTRFRRIATGAAMAVAAVLATGGLAAARALPQPIQRLASDALQAVGIDVPASIDDHPNHDERPAAHPASPPAAVAPTPPPTTAPPAPAGATPSTAPAPPAPVEPEPASVPPTPPIPTTPPSTTPPTSTPPTTAPPPVVEPSDNGIGNGGFPGQGGANPNASGNNRGGNSTKK